MPQTKVIGYFQVRDIIVSVKVNSKSLANVFKSLVFLLIVLNLSIILIMSKYCDNYWIHIAARVVIA